jgi:hypothetical protein
MPTSRVSSAPGGQGGLMTLECFLIDIEHATRTALAAAVSSIRFDRPQRRRVDRFRYVIFLRMFR